MANVDLTRVLFNSCHIIIIIIVIIISIIMIIIINIIIIIIIIIISIIIIERGYNELTGLNSYLETTSIRRLEVCRRRCHGVSEAQPFRHLFKQCF